MKKINFSKIILSIVAAAVISIALPQTAFAIGQLTEPIVFEDVLRGQIVQETLALYGSEEKETAYGLVADGDIKDWVTFYLPEDLENPIQEIKIPAKSQVSVIAQFQTPEDIPNGTYSGTVAIVSLPEKTEETEGTSAEVRLRVDREVSIAITDKEIIEFETTIIPLKYGMGRNEPLKIKVIYENQGNISIKPGIHLKITQLSTGNIVHSAIYPYPENENSVKPFERKEFPSLIEWQTAGQENGKYQAEITVLLQDEVIQEESFRFDVGVNIITLLLVRIDNLFGGNLTLAWFVIGGILLAIAGILAFFYKKPELLKAGVAPIRNRISNGVKKIKNIRVLRK